MSNQPALREKLIAVLEPHWFSDIRLGCNCGEDDEELTRNAHFVDVLFPVIAEEIQTRLLEQHVSECEVCRIENGEQVYCNMADEIRKRR